MKHLNTYSCFSDAGEIKLPNQEELNVLIQSETEPILFLDSCVCLHIIKVVDYGKKATNVDLSKIIELKEYIAAHEVNISPMFGLLELSLKEGEINESKLMDFKHRIDFFKQIKLKDFKKFKYDFNKNYIILNEKPLSINIPPELHSSLKRSYCALLKIRSLSPKKLSKQSAIINIDTFLDWMINELDIILGIEYNLALNIFGGNTEFRSMIGLDCKQTDIKKKIKGSTWDIFHSKNASNSYNFNKILANKVYPIFMTNDTKLFRLFKNFKFSFAKDGDEISNTSSFYNSDFSYPHFDNTFLEYNNKKMIKLFIDRRDKTSLFDSGKIDTLIKQLEIENNILN